jgi:hypothetical protein
MCGCVFTCEPAGGAAGFFSCGEHAAGTLGQGLIDCFDVPKQWRPLGAGAQGPEVDARLESTLQPEPAKGGVGDSELLGELGCCCVKGRHREPIRRTRLNVVSTFFVQRCSLLVFHRPDKSKEN